MRRAGSLEPFTPSSASAREGVWSPDGKYLIFAGCRDASATSCDTWVARLEGGEPVATGVARHLGGQPTPDLWLAATRSSLRLRTVTKVDSGSRSLRMTRGGRSAPTASRSDEYDAGSSAAGPGGKIVFAGRTMNIDLWSLPLDADHARVTGTLTRLTVDPAIDQRPSLSVDGRKVAWETSRGGNFEVWVKDLVSKKEHGLTSGPLREHMPAIPATAREWPTTRTMVRR